MEKGQCSAPRPRAGWTGDDCKTPFKRSCSVGYRAKWDDPPRVRVRPPQASARNLRKGARSPLTRSCLCATRCLGAAQAHTNADGMDLNITADGWLAARCAGWWR